MKTKPLAVIFDLDGTLLDTLADLAETTNLVLSGLRQPTHAVDDYRYLVGDGVRVLFERALPPNLSGDAAMIDRCVARFETEYETRWNLHSSPYPGIADLLNQLVSQQIPIAILSNKPQAFAEKCVQQLLGDWNFDPIFGQREGIPRKPDPAGVKEILSHWKISADECLYVGDTNTDMQTGRSAGCITIGVTWGFRPRQELESAGAQVIIDHPSELLAIIRS